jgi:hypothetical protein
MVLNTAATEALRRAELTESDLPASLDGFDQFTLPGLLELVASAAGLPANNHFSRCFERGLIHGAMTSECWRVLNGGNAVAEDIHGTRTVEFYRLRTPDDCINQQYQLFRERFVRSLRSAGFPKELAYALAGAFSEMIDNIIQHSEDTSDEYSGLVGYSVAEKYMAFGVVDVGRGVLASLSTSPKWRHLGTAREALRSAVCESASRRLGKPKGEGFRTVFRSMVDRNAMLRFRTDDALLTIGDGGAHRQAVELCSPQLSGLQVSVCCALNRPAQEEEIIPC